MKKLAAANWKMNGDLEFVKEFFAQFEKHDLDNVETLFSVPSPLVAELATHKTSHNILVGAEDCHYQDKGAFTGDVSPKLLKSLGADYVILGHSERREYHLESNQLVRDKVEAALRNNLVPIICIGETEAEREEGLQNKVVEEQLLNSVPNDIDQDFVVAYEPVWAIGTGKVPTIEDIAEILACIRQLLQKFSNIDAEKIRILYGGSANGKNCTELAKIENLSGYLVGSASLKPEEFSKIIKSLA